jgi:hypothetical protein
MELTIEQGALELFFRLPINWQKNVETLELTTDEGGLEAGRSYTYEFAIIGSTLVDQDKAEELVQPRRNPVSWIQIRKGAFGIAVPPGTKLKITKLRAKVLR